MDVCLIEYRVQIVDVVNINDAKTHLSALINRAAAGETVRLGRRNKPVARLTPLAQASSAPKKRRPIGLAKGAFTLTPAFFEPPNDVLLDLWEGKSIEPDTIANVKVKAKAKASR